MSHIQIGVEKIKYSTAGASFKVTFSVPIDEIGYLQVLYNKYSEVNGCGFSTPTEIAEQTEPKVSETPTSSEKPNNCENEDIFEYCPRCGMRILVSKPKDEPQFDKDINVRSKDEPQIVDWGKRKPCTLELFDDDGNYIEPKDEPLCSTCKYDEDKRFEVICNTCNSHRNHYKPKQTDCPWK